MVPGCGTIRGTHSCVKGEVMVRKMQRQLEEVHCTGAHGTDFPRMRWCLLSILSALKFSRTVIIIGKHLLLTLWEDILSYQPK